MRDNTYRAVDISDPLDQGHYESQTLDERRENIIGLQTNNPNPPTLTEVSPNSMNGNIYNVTNTINVHVGG